jgi:small-conductance mechanosensitive channel
MAGHQAINDVPQLRFGLLDQALHAAAHVEQQGHLDAGFAVGIATIISYGGIGILGLCGGG